MTAPRKETTLPTILARYQLKDIFDADEFGLFYQALPSKSFHFQGKRFSGGKQSKVWSTRMTASNALDEKIPMFVIGQSASPWCFKHVRNLPCRYWSQKKVWMDGTLFEEWLHKLNCKLEIQVRNVFMIVNNCPVHLEVSGLSIYSFCHQITLLMGQKLIRYIYFIIFLFY